MPDVELIKVTKDYVHSFGGKVLYITLSGSDLYGFPSKDSDKDYRGSYLIRTNLLHGINTPRDVIEHYWISEGKDNDTVLFELKKELGLMMKNNCNVLEHIFSPPEYTSPEHHKLKDLANLCLAKDGLYNSYRGMAYENFNKFIRVGKAGIKKYLYCFRALLACNHVLQTGKIEASIVKLNNQYGSRPIDQLIEMKINGEEKDELKEADPKLDLIMDNLFLECENHYKNSVLPEAPDKDAIEKVDEFLKKLRRENMDVS